MEKIKKILISIIVPIYNIELYLRKCVDSIINQSYTNLEIILVDDGSPDLCPLICDEYKAKDNRIKVIHKKNGGLVSARKAGLAVSTGTLIGYVDGDDWIEPHFYEALYMAYISSNADVIIDGFSRDILDVSERITNNIEPGLYEGGRLKNIVYAKMLCAGDFFYFGIYSYLWNKLFKRDVLFENQMNVDERIFVGEDIACTFPALLKANSLHIIDKCLYHYEQRTGSMLKTIEDFKIENSRLAILEEYLRTVFEKSGYGDILIPQLDRYMEGIRLIRGDSYCYSSDCCYPFGKIPTGSRVAIYSAGTFGQNLYARMIEKRCCQIVAWYDTDYIQYQRQGLDVKSIDKIDEKTFDKVIIASLDKRFINETVKYLETIGVTSLKILALC